MRVVFDGFPETIRSGFACVLFYNAAGIFVVTKAGYLHVRRLLRNPGDEMVLETAVNGRADLLVTFNVRDFGPVPERFGIAVLIIP